MQELCDRACKVYEQQLRVSDGRVHMFHYHDQLDIGTLIEDVR